MKSLFIYDFGIYWGDVFFTWFWNALAWLGIITILRKIFWYLLAKQRAALKEKLGKTKED